jgi:hypothetical protein
MVYELNTTVIARRPIGRHGNPLLRQKLMDCFVTLFLAMTLFYKNLIYRLALPLAGMANTKDSNELIKLFNDFNDHPHPPMAV